MLFLTTTVILNVFILIIFRYLSHFSVNTFQTIIVNYIICVITGTLVYPDLSFWVEIWLESWIWLPLILGVIFVTTFFLIAKTAQLYSVAIASLASKVSLAIPVAFSLWIFQIQMKEFSLINYLGLSLTFVAIVLSSLKENFAISSKAGPLLILLPLSVFLLSGIIDTSLNYANIYHLRGENANRFTIMLFLSAAISGLIIFIFQKKKFDKKSLTWGTALGIINFFSVIFILKTLNYFGNDGAFTFPMININIIIFSTVASRFLFKEKWTKSQIAGLVVGVVSLLFIAYQEVLNFFF